MTAAEERWLRLARRVLPPEDRDWLFEELVRLHRHRVARDGPGRALRALRREVMGFALGQAGRGMARLHENGRRRMGGLMREIRLAARGLARAPGFAAVAVLSLAVGIGANTLIFTLVDSVLLRPLPYPAADRLVRIWDNAQIPAVELDYFAEHATTLDGVAAWLPGVGANLQAEGEPIRLIGARVSARFLELLGSPLALGAGFSAQALVRGGPDEVVLSHAFWTDRYGADAGLLGRAVNLDGRPHTVVGILRPGEGLPSTETDFLVPLRPVPGTGNYWGSYSLYAIGRLAPGASAQQATLELRQFVGGPLRDTNPIWTPAENYRSGSSVVPLRDALVENVQGRLVLLMAAVTVVLLVVSANVGNLLLVRGLARRQDMAVRAALGAGRARLLTHHLTEGLLLSLVGSALGLALAQVGLVWFRPELSNLLPQAGSLELDGRVLGLTAMITVLTGLATGSMGALRGLGRSPQALLRAARGAGGAPARQRLSRGLVAGQIAAAVVLVVSAGLLIRSLGSLGGIDPGFGAQDLITARVDLSPLRYREPGALLAAVDELQTRLQADPALASVSLAGSVPFGGGGELSATYLDGITEDPNVLPFFRRFRVTPDYFRTMGIELVQGRLLTSADGADGEAVTVIDEAAAHEEFPGVDPVGRILRQFGPSGAPVRIVGVVRSVRDDPITDDPVPTEYRPLRQSLSGTSLWMVARHRGDAAVGLRALERAVSSVDPGAPISQAFTYPALIADGWSDTRLLATVLGLFAAVTLLLGGLGVYGVSGYMVRRRTREFGVRVALGASPRGIRAAVVRDGAFLALAGSVAGIVLAVPVARTLGSLLVGVAPLDPWTFLAVPLILTLTTVLAVFLPARRATRVDPSRVLREE